MRTVAVAVIDDTALFELGIVNAIFGADPPHVTGDWYELIVCAPRDATVGQWFRVATPHGLDALASADTVVVPACHDRDLRPPAELIEAVATAHEAGARIASICTGAFVLAAAGLLDGRRATTHWVHAGLLAERYPAVQVDRDVLYIDDGDVLTSAGKAAGIDLCLHMVAADRGTEVANDLARRMVVPPHRAGGQAQFVTAPLGVDGQSDMADVLSWAVDHLHEPLAVTDLARRAAMSTRTLGRHFATSVGTSPLQWLLHQRIQRARELLESTGISIDLVAEAVGFGSAATLRRHFRSVVGVPPDAYRRTFRRAAERDADTLAGRFRCVPGS